MSLKQLLTYCLLAACASPALGGFTFALIGDIPYNVAPGQNYPPFQRIVDAVNADTAIKWVLHAGDIKSGATDCSDALYRDRLARFNRFNKPFILTPGDNEWTDCHRVSTGQYRPLERLAKLREIYYPNPGETLGGTRMRVDTQADSAGFEEFPENVRWSEQKVIFATAHVVGSENGLRAFDRRSSVRRTAADDDEVARRIEAARAWIDATFDHAEQLDSPAVCLMIHGNPGLDGRPPHRGYHAILQTLEARTRAFARPVMLIHGDTHTFRVDNPPLLQERTLVNFTRVETFGAPQVHWLRIAVDPTSHRVFTVHQVFMEAGH